MEQNTRLNTVDCYWYRAALKLICHRKVEDAANAQIDFYVLAFLKYQVRHIAAEVIVHC